jgi:hypothetical protein
VAARQHLAVADLALEIVEDRRQLLRQRLLDALRVGLLLEEGGLHGTLEEDGSHRVHQPGVAVLLVPERATELPRIGRAEGRVGRGALEVGDDAGRVGEHEVTVLVAGNLSERALRPELLPLAEGQHGLEIVADRLLGEGDAHLAHERGEADSVDDGHEGAPF